jgi:hypothetical protein
MEVYKQTFMRLAPWHLLNNTSWLVLSEYSISSCAAFILNFMVFHVNFLVANWALLVGYYIYENYISMIYVELNR